MIKGRFSQLFTLLCYLVALGVELIGSTVIGSMRNNGQLTENGYIYASYLLPQLCYLAVIVVFAAVVRIPANDFIKKERLKPIPYAYLPLILFGLFFTALLPNYYLQKALAFSGTNSTVHLPPMQNAGQIVGAIVVLCLLPALGEELMFRKVFCEGMKGNNEWMIVAMGGLLFSLTHFNLVQTVHQFVLGCVLCFLYVRTENITLTMIIHFSNNLLALFIEGWTAGVIDWYKVETLAIACAIGVVCLSAGLFLVWKRERKPEETGGKVEPYTIALNAGVGVLWLISVITSYIN